MKAGIKKKKRVDDNNISDSFIFEMADMWCGVPAGINIKSPRIVIK